MGGGERTMNEGVICLVGQDLLHKGKKDRHKRMKAISAAVSRLRFSFTYGVFGYNYAASDVFK